MITAKPTVHINGTSRESLQAQYREVYSKINDVLDALAQSNPHMRDYYVQEDADAFKRAQADQARRVAKLASIQKDMTELFLGLD